MRRFWTMALLITACTGTTPPDDKSSDTDDTDVTTDSAVNDPCADLPEPPDGTAMISGKVVDAQGAAVGRQEISVRACRGDVCISAQKQDCEGNYGIYNLDAGVWSFELVPKVDDPYYATVLSAFPTDSSSARAIDVTVPVFTNVQTLTETAAEYEVAPGLFLTVASTDLKKPSPLDPDPTDLAGVDATDILPPTEGIEGTIVASWYLDPFDYESETPLPIRLTNTWGYADGEAELWIVRYTVGVEKVGDLIDDGNGALTVSEGLDILTTLMVVEKPTN